MTSAPQLRPDQPADRTGDRPRLPFDQPFLPAAAEGAEITRLRATGQLRRLVGDVHVAADLWLDPVLRAQAARLLVSGALLARGAVVGFASAAWIHAEWSDPGCERADGRHLEQLELIVPPAVRYRPTAGICRARQMRLPPGHVALLGGLPLTTPARTAADLARELPISRARTAMTALAARTGLTVADVLRCLDEMPRARGCARARGVVAGWQQPD